MWDYDLIKVKKQPSTRWIFTKVKNGEICSLPTGSANITCGILCGCCFLPKAVAFQVLWEECNCLTSVPTCFSKCQCVVTIIKFKTQVANWSHTQLRWPSIASTCNFNLIMVPFSQGMMGRQQHSGKEVIRSNFKEKTDCNFFCHPILKGYCASLLPY